jgi:hypothetical protein
VNSDAGGAFNVQKTWNIIQNHGEILLDEPHAITGGPVMDHGIQSAVRKEIHQGEQGQSRTTTLRPKRGESRTVFPYLGKEDQKRVPQYFVYVQT